MAWLPAARASVQRMRDAGARGVAQRIARRAYQATGAASLDFGLDFGDIMLEAPDSLPMPSRPLERDCPARIGWVISAPAPGSGGHTTLFRMVRALENRGHRCALYVYDRHGVDTDRLRERIAAHWPWIHPEVRDARAGIRDVDAVIATSWESAHILVRYGIGPLRRLYFVQDYEPYFYGHGAECELAAMTYRLPVRLIVLGDMLDGILRRETGLTGEVVPFGCDVDAYRLRQKDGPRSGVVFYSRPDYPRRGYQLACAALLAFHRAFPREPIHVYGAPPRGLDLPHEFHGWLPVAELADLYRSTVAGLALSFTNITLVAEEMLAAGTIPVVNDLELARTVLPNAFVRWADPSPAALAGQLGAAVSVPDRDAVARAAAESVTGRSWEATGEALATVVERELYEMPALPLATAHGGATS